MASPETSNESPLNEILAGLKALQVDNAQLASAVDEINGRVNMLAGVKQVHDAASTSSANGAVPMAATKNAKDTKPAQTVASVSEHYEGPAATNIEHPSRRPSTTSKIILTSYPGQAGVDPLIMNWGHKDPNHRGPVVVSRHSNTIRRRNAIGAHGGSYAIYHALAVASKNLDVDHKPDFTNTEPAANIGPFPQWSDPKKIVSMDPLGHLAPWLFIDIITKENVEIRPTIAVTRAHMKLPELEHSVKAGRLVPDGKICLNDSGELAVTKFAVEPVWYLPGVAERFGIGKHTRGVYAS
jgi:hypothetical protein